MKRLIFFLLCSLFALPCHAETVLKIQQLETGKKIPFWFVQDTHLPLVALKFSLVGGSALDPVGQEGAANLLSTVLDEGAGKHDAASFQRDLDRFGIKMGFDASNDYFSGSLKTTSDFQDTSFELLSDALNKPHITKEAATRMRDSLQSQLRFLQTDPNYSASRAMMETLFKGHALARPVEGTVTSLEKITPQDLQHLRQRLFCKQRLKIGVVGNLNAAEAKKRIDTVFGDWPSCTESLETTAFVPNTKNVTVTIPRAGAQSLLLMVQQGVARQDTDWWAARILDFALGGGSFSSRLMDEVRVKRGMTYGIATDMALYRSAPLWVIQASLDPKYSATAPQLIRRIWQDVATHGLTAKEIQQAKDYMIGMQPLMMTTSDQIASLLLQLQEQNLPVNTLDLRATQIRKVTQQDIQRVAKERLQPQALALFIVGGEKK